MRKRSFVKVCLCLFLLAGCVSQEWVEKYVGQEITAAKEHVGQEITRDTQVKLWPLKQALSDNEVQIKILKKGIGRIDIKLTQLTAELARFTESLEEAHKSYKRGLSGVEGVMAEETEKVSDKIKDLNEKLRKLDKGLVTFQKSMEVLERKLEETREAGGP
ncbi:MAG: hypothetical protein ACE5KK_08115 [Candidatus Brocadiales bacterium]